MRITPLDEDFDAGRKYLNQRSLQIGHVLPLDENLFKEYFPPGSSFLLYKGRTVDGLFSYDSGREKRAPLANFTLATDSILGLKEVDRSDRRHRRCPRETRYSNTGFRIRPRTTPGIQGLELPGRSVCARGRLA